MNSLLKQAGVEDPNDDLEESELAVEVEEESQVYLIVCTFLVNFQ